MASFEAYRSASGWTALAASADVVRSKRLEQDIVVDYVVVGAGFAGVSAAHCLVQHDPSASVVILEADELLQNSSTRNSGFMIDLPYTKIDQRTSEAVEQWHIELMQRGREQLWQAVVDDPMHKEYWQEAGHYKVASSTAGVRTLESIQQQLIRKKVDYQRLTAKQCTQDLGTSYYQAALWMPHCTLVQPARLLQRLLQQLPDSVSIYSHSAVQARVAGQKQVTLQVGAHQVKARYVVWATNVHSMRLGLSTSRQLPIYTYACLTAPIEPTQQTLGSKAVWGATPVEQLEATTRKLADGRLLFRSGFSYKKELSLEAQQQLLYAGIHQCYPEISQEQIEYVWGGAVSMTRNGHPICKKIASNELQLSGCNASGLLKMTALAAVGVDYLLGKSTPFLQQSLGYSKPSYIPPEPLRRLAVHIKTQSLKK